MGELVFTTLTKEGLPIVRYRTRDLTRLLPGTARSMRRMEKITGRSDDMIILRGVNVFPTQIEEQILKCAGLAPHFQIELTPREPDGRDDGSRRMRCRTMPTAEARACVGQRTGASHQVGRRRLDQDHRADPEHVARSEGKAKRVVDNRPKED